MSEPIRIMLIEDHAGFRKVITLAFSRNPDIELISQFSTAETALRILQYPKEGERPNLILLDVNLPGISGIEALKWIKEYSSETKVIMLTQSDQEEDILQAISMGAEGYLLKSATVNQIKEGIQTVMQGGASLDPKVAKVVLQHVQPQQDQESSGMILSSREIDILKLLGEGLVKKEIAQKLGISITTVAFHVRNIYDKLEVQNAPSAVAKGYRSGLIK